MIASVGPDIPIELLQATGRYAGPLGWNIDRAFPKAEQWLESKFPPWAFSMLEDWAAGALDHLEAVVFSRSDDSAQRLYYYICELRTRRLMAGPEPLIFDVARIGRASSAARCVDAVRGLAARLGVSDAALEAAIVAVKEGAGEVAEDTGPVCLLGGTPPPDDRLFRSIAAAGWLASGKTLADVWRGNLAPAASGTGDPCAALGRRLHASRSGTRGFYDRGAAIVSQARATGAEAVVLWYAEEDEAEIWHLPAQLRALKAEGIPALALTRRDWRAADAVGQEIAAFLSIHPSPSGEGPGVGIVSDQRASRTSPTPTPPLKGRGL
jgi:hypothetical protein